MVLFICSTPYHIYNAVSLVNTIYSDSEKDLYILDHSASNYEIYLNLKGEKIFDNILFLRTKNLTGGGSSIPLIRYYNSFKHLLNSRYVTNQIFNDKVYDSIFISSPDIPSQLIYYFYKNKTNATQLFMYEDGTFAYSYFDFQFNFFKKLFIKVIFGRDIMNEHTGVYVYRPEFLQTNKMVKINKLPSINKKDINIKNLLNKIMNYQDSYQRELDKPYIFFDQAFQFNSSMNRGKQLLQFIITKTESDKVTVKLHPRTVKSTYENLCKVTNLPIPFELFELNNEVEEKVLISISSTACLNPKIVYDEEPYVILLFKLLDNSIQQPLNSTFYDIVFKVKNSYRDINKFFIPETIEELENILNVLESNKE
ncbi:hypothetical protein SAMN05443252_104102 [Bacillus sp. OV322]|uniref:hypothetical protein n=1 Tax=Bacillus sp. OV322 TaxID=1882764 RepID=UPI0008E7C2A4|nr:hypothetical protein [Bacillus sp. OV322]SFC52500.1 hypothetical protein SAMN05443252_104102 [Bacillus sp. OV322]